MPEAATTARHATAPDAPILVGNESALTGGALTAHGLSFPFRLAGLHQWPAGIARPWAGVESAVGQDRTSIGLAL